MTTPKVWVTGEVLEASDLNPVAAQASDALKPSGNLSGLADAAAARTNLGLGDVLTDIAAAQGVIDGLSDVASSGDYDDLGNVPVENSDAESEALEFIDDNMEVFLRISPAQLTALGFTLTTAGVLTVVTSTATTSTTDTLNISTAAALDASDGLPGYDLIDENMEVIERTEADGARTAHGTTTDTSDAPAGWAVIDDNMERLLLVDGDGAHFPGLQISVNDASAGLEFIDDNMEVISRFTASGLADGFGGSGSAHSADEQEWRHGQNLADAAMMGVVRADDICSPLAKYNHAIVYGQSLGQGAEGQPVLSTAAKYGNVMLGNIAASVSNVMPDANNATPPTFEVTGTAVFNALVATGYNEIVVHGALNTYRRMTLHHRGVTADADHLWIGTTAAVGGQAIAALSKGASPELYNRLVSLMDQAHTAATNASADYLVPALLWLQGESNQTTDKATYLAALRQFITDFRADAITETSQQNPPAIFLYQTVAPNSNFDGTNLGVQMAQLDAALNDDGVFMVGPNYPYPDSNNLHLPSNSYRWLGSMFGKVMFRVFTLGQRWKPLHIRRATLRGREILIDYHVPHPPLVFENPWLQDGWTVGETDLAGTNTQYAVPNKGFTIRTSGGTDLTVESVEIVSDTQIMVTLDAAPAAAPNLFYANGRQDHHGHGCVRDSDPTLAEDAWQHVTSRTDADDNDALVGARYPLPNWAVAQFLTVES
jgi:hypothetical protein